MKQSSLRLFVRLCTIYACALLTGSAIITVIMNMLINGIPFRALLQFNIKALAAGDLLFFLIVSFITFLRLRTVRHVLDGRLDGKYTVAALRILYRFPSEMFWGMLGLSLFFSILFHTASFISKGYFPLQLSEKQILNTLQSLFSEMTLALTLAVLFFTLIRSSLRPYIIKLQEGQAAPFAELLQGKNRDTLLKPFLITFGSCLFIASFSVLDYLHTAVSKGKRPDLAVAAEVFGFYTLFGLSIFSLTAFDFQKEFRATLNRLRSLLGRDDNKGKVGRLPILSEDELGQLASSVNLFRGHIQGEYKKLQHELQLAYKVQQKLIPESYQAAGTVEISAVCLQSSEVGGDFYDIVRISEHQTAVLNGDVSGKGLSAALLMSALMVLFRKEIRQGGSAADVLTRLNRRMTETLQGEMFITAGLAIVDTRDGTLEYASAGHMSPYLVREGQIEQLMFSSLPLGIDEEEEYRCKHFSVADGARFVLYTDGVVERPGDAEIGFERLEKTLKELSQGATIQLQMKELIEALKPSGQSDYEDDWTMVMIGGRSVSNL